MNEAHKAVYVLSILQITTPAKQFLTKAFGPNYRDDKTIRVAEDRAGHSIAGILCLLNQTQQEKMLQSILEYDENLLRARLARLRRTNKK